MLVGRTGLSPVMVGRSGELDRLAALVDTAEAPTVAIVAGEPGIGKTRLLQELVARLPPSARLLTGQADPDTNSLALALYLDALDSLPPDAAGDPELTSIARDCDRSSDERIRAAVELARQCTRQAHQAVLIFEDLHWSDSESLAVFERLAEPDGGSLLLVGTYRPSGLSRRHPASDLLPRLERRHSVTHLRLERLSQNDVGVFLEAVYGQLPSYRLVKELHARTGGNPFFLEELLATCATMPSDDLDAMPLPWTVAEVVRAQVEELAPDVRRIVTAAAELGRRVPFDVLATVTGTSEDDLILLLRAAVDSGLMVETDPDVFGFHHELAREAIAGQMLGRERRRLHEAAFEALRQAGSKDHGALCRHARGAHRFDDMVEHARRGTHSALAHGSSYQALQLAEWGLDEAEDDLDLLAVAARAAWLAGLEEDAVRHGVRWLELARRADDISQEAMALRQRMRLAFEAGDMAEMAGFSDDLIGVVDRLPNDEERANAMAALAQAYMLREEVGSTCEWADKAQELAEAHGLTEVRLAAVVEKGSVLLNDPSTVDEARTLLDEAITEADRIGQHVLAVRAINNLVWNALAWSDADQARKLIEQGRHHAESAGWLSGSGHSIALAQLATVEGDLDQARAHLDTSEMPIADQVAWKKGRWAAVLRAGLALEADDLEAATRHAAEAKPATKVTKGANVGLDVHLALRHERLDEARARLVDLLEVVSEDGYAHAPSTHDIVAAGLRAGLVPQELRPLVDMLGGYPGHRLGPEDAWRHLLDAQLTEAEGRIEQAAELYSGAAASLEAAPGVMAGHRGTAHIGAARCLIALGRLDEARRHVQAAAAHLASWRGWRVDELRAVERRLGLGPEPAGPTTLTRREREVAGLLAEGLTNSQLAERLYISPRTAAVHVSNILAKLGMSSRTEVAAWVAGGGLTRSDLARR